MNYRKDQAEYGSLVNRNKRNVGNVENMQARYSRLGKKEHFRTVRSCAVAGKEVDWYALAQEKKRAQAHRLLKLKRLAEIKRAQMAWEDALVERDC